MAGKSKQARAGDIPHDLAGPSQKEAGSNQSRSAMNGHRDRVALGDTRAASKQRVTREGCPDGVRDAYIMVPPGRLERPHPAPEAGALSAELWGPATLGVSAHQVYHTQPATSSNRHRPTDRRIRAYPPVAACLWLRSSLCYNQRHVSSVRFPRGYPIWAAWPGAVKDIAR